MRVHQRDSELEGRGFGHLPRRERGYLGERKMKMELQAGGKEKYNRGLVRRRRMLGWRLMSHYGDQ